MDLVQQLHLRWAYVVRSSLAERSFGRLSVGGSHEAAERVLSRDPLGAGWGCRAAQDRQFRDSVSESNLQVKMN